MPDTFNCSACKLDHPTMRADGQPNYAMTREDGEGNICLACSFKREVDMMRTYHTIGKAYGCYLSTDGAKVTTWHGEALSAIATTHAIKHPWHGVRGMLAVRIVDRNGNGWHGRGCPGMFLALRPLKRAKVYTVKVSVTDLQYDGGSLCANGCWRREYIASAPTRAGAIRKALAQYATGWRFNSWAGNSESWKLPNTMIGACTEELTEEDKAKLSAWDDFND